MADKSASQLNIEIGQRIQEKFDAYLLGLIFTLLGLSIQTAKFGASRVADTLEILAWLLLLAAGLAGLSRLEWIPEQYRLYALRLEKEELAHGAEKAVLEGAHEFHVLPLGKAVPASQYIAEAKDSVAKIENVLDPVEKKGRRKYHIMKWTFVAALATLMVARAFIPIKGIVAPDPQSSITTH
jgi:hypothetical protein